MNAAGIYGQGNGGGGVGEAKVPNSILYEHSHVAYQIKGNEE